MTVMERLTDWNTVLSTADLSAPELVQFLVEIHNLPQADAQAVVDQWLYSDCT